MKIKYRNQKIQKALSSEKEANRQYGKRLAEKIFQRIQYLSAAPDLASVSPEPPYRRHKLKGNYAGYFSVDLNENWRLIFHPITLNKKEEYSLEDIKEISIETVEDYH